MLPMTISLVQTLFDYLFLLETFKRIKFLSEKKFCNLIDLFVRIRLRFGINFRNLVCPLLKAKRKRIELRSCEYPNEKVPKSSALGTKNRQLRNSDFLESSFHKTFLKTFVIKRLAENMISHETIIHKIW
jgi:hypothetical protein